MSSGFGLAVLIPWLLLLPVVVGHWVGIFGLGKAKRSGDWWCMLIGVCFTTLGNLLWLVLMLSQFMGNPSLAHLGGFQIYYAVSGCSGLGSILFAAGFAVHGQRKAKDAQRIQELESIAQAQGEELARSQQG